MNCSLYVFRLILCAGLLLIVIGCSGKKEPELDLETGTIQAPPASPPVVTEAPAPEAFRSDPMAPPEDAPLNVPNNSTGDEAEESDAELNEPVDQSKAAPVKTSAGSASSKIEKSVIQVPQ